MKRSHFVLLSIVIVIVVLAIIGNNLPDTPAASVTPHTIAGEHGTINIPGNARIEAFDPATNSNIPSINLWTAAGFGVRPACSLVDGDGISLSNSTRAEGRTWVYATSGSCSGWLLTEFVQP